MYIRFPQLSRCLLVISALCCAIASQAQKIWVEGENPVKSTMTRHPWWYDLVKKDQLSGNDFISNWNEKVAGEAEYSFKSTVAGEHEFWVRANPTASKLLYQLNGGAWIPIDLQKQKTGEMNIAADDKIDLRFIAWEKVGNVTLKKGENIVAFRMDSENNHHGILDCFVFSVQPFNPLGAIKTGTVAAVKEDSKDWFAFNPGGDISAPGSAIDLRGLNEKQAGDGGQIVVQNGQFVHSKTGEAVRFWAVNGPPGDVSDAGTLQQIAKKIARYGVNLVRLHGGVFDEVGQVNPKELQRRLDVVKAMKGEGVYTHLSIYFPLWAKPKADSPMLKGYDGTKNPFASLYFNKDFQNTYHEWWKAILLTPDSVSGKKLIDEPALMGVEIINEDSYFFWTFAAANIPDTQMKILETQFGDWAKKKYGSPEAALTKWGGAKIDRDAPEQGRLAFRPLWNMFSEKTRRDMDTAEFLLNSQRTFYKETVDFLRGLGYKGLITCSNWATASPEVFGPLEKYSYTVGDFIDRHGYFGSHNAGVNSEWSIQNGHTYEDRSALRFDAEDRTKPKQFVHPIMDIHYNGMPSMISETTFCRPNRYRSEAPLYFAAYGALQGSDAIVHFALDSRDWAVKPGYFMQPWTLMTPAMFGQFPAAALIYRQGLVATGPSIVDLNLKIQDLLELKGTPLPQDASFDELRLKDVPKGTEIKPGSIIDPLVYYVGRTTVNFTDAGAPAKLADLTKFIDRSGQAVSSSTGQLKLDYGKGLLTINAPAAQGVSGDLAKAGAITLKDLIISSTMDNGHIVAVSLDGKPLVQSTKILLQVMSEEKASGFATEKVTVTMSKITDIGHDPWLVRNISGEVKFTRPGAQNLKVTELDYNGYPSKSLGNASSIKLSPTVMYYLLSM